MALQRHQAAASLANASEQLASLQMCQKPVMWGRLCDRADCAAGSVGLHYTVLQPAVMLQGRAHMGMVLSYMMCSFSSCNL